MTVVLEVTIWRHKGACTETWVYGSTPRKEMQKWPSLSKSDRPTIIVDKWEWNTTNVSLRPTRAFGHQQRAVGAAYFCHSKRNLHLLLQKLLHQKPSERIFAALKRSSEEGI
ncbi:hypothetical protein N7527_010990 [Penicillium freii]|nr:hypothetical protein N7527_010990 [Penicillium freii]